MRNLIIAIAVALMASGAAAQSSPEAKPASQKPVKNPAPSDEPSAGYAVSGGAGQVRDRHGRSRFGGGVRLPIGYGLAQQPDAQSGVLAGDASQRQAARLGQEGAAGDSQADAASALKLDAEEPRRDSW